ncbi:MAG: cytochrome c maturation protein CcmE [Microthrixaceae bacterium]
MEPHPGPGAPHRDDDESVDATTGGTVDLDVTPRTHAESTRRAGGPRRWLALAGVLVLIGALGLVLVKGLSDAALFYYNVDEAVAKQDELGDQRFRMQGNVIDGTIEETADGVSFVIAYGDRQLQVVNSGAPPELFQPEIPVILEGNLAERSGEPVFLSDQILIRHDSTYDEQNEDRIKQAEDDAQQRAGSAG